MNRWWKLGSLLPTIIVVVGLANFALCFRSLDWLAFRSWEAALREQASEHAGSIGPFEPGASIYVKRAYGDLAGLGNIRDLREYRSEDFHVDRLGFRNPSLQTPSHVAGLIVGDSFAAGAGLPDSATLAAVLSRDTGDYYFNAAGDEDPFQSAEEVVPAIHLAKGVVVLQLLERTLRRNVPRPHPVRHETDNPVNSTLPEAFRSMPGNRAVDLFLSDHSPAILLSQKALKTVENGHLLPNPFDKNVVRKTLQNGDEILFYPDDLAQIEDTPALVSAWRSRIQDFQRELRQKNLSLIVVLVPNKFTVYGSLLATRPELLPGQSLLSRLDNELQSSAVPVVDLTPLFQAAARREFPQRRYIYWRDDTHWNPDGVSLAAGAIHSAIEQEHLGAASDVNSLAQGVPSGSGSLLP